MKKILIILLCFPALVQAQGIEKGYRGMVDVGYCLYISQIDPSTIELTTSHGYQFNPYIYLGAGTGFDFTGSCSWGEVAGMAYHKRDSKVDIPLFFNARANFTKTKIIPFVDGRIGSYVNNDGGIYATLTLGARYAIGNGIGLSFAAGYQIRKVTAQQLNLHYVNYKSYHYYTDLKDQSVDGFVFKLGVDF